MDGLGDHMKPTFDVVKEEMNLDALNFHGSSHNQELSPKACTSTFIMSPNVHVHSIIFYTRCHNDLKA